MLDDSLSNESQIFFQRAERSFETSGMLSPSPETRPSVQRVRGEGGGLRHAWHVDTWWTGIESRSASSRVRVDRPLAPPRLLLPRSLPRREGHDEPRGIQIPRERIARVRVSANSQAARIHSRADPNCRLEIGAYVSERYPRPASSSLTPFLPPSARASRRGIISNVNVTSTCAIPSPFPDDDDDRFVSHARLPCGYLAESFPPGCASLSQLEGSARWMWVR